MQEVSGGNDFTDGALIIGSGVTIAHLAGILGATVATGFIALPLVAAFSVGLVGLGGYHIGRGFRTGTVTVGGDHIGGLGRDSDC